MGPAKVVNVSDTNIKIKCKNNRIKKLNVKYVKPFLPESAQYKNFNDADDNFQCDSNIKGTNNFEQFQNDIRPQRPLTRALTRLIHERHSINFVANDLHQRLSNICIQLYKHNVPINDLAEADRLLWQFSNRSTWMFPWFYSIFKNIKINSDSATATTTTTTTTTGYAKSKFWWKQWTFSNPPHPPTLHLPLYANANTMIITFQSKTFCPTLHVEFLFCQKDLNTNFEIWLFTIKCFLSKGIPLLTSTSLCYRKDTFDQPWGYVDIFFKSHNYIYILTHPIPVLHYFSVNPPKEGAVYYIRVSCFIFCIRSL